MLDSDQLAHQKPANLDLQFSQDDIEFFLIYVPSVLLGQIKITIRK